jgi:hypothetical protein
MTVCLNRHLAVFCLIILVLSSSAAFGAECLSLSPTLQAGKNPYVQIIVRDLTLEEHKSLERMFRSMAGKWSGGAETFFCTSAENAADIDKDLETGNVLIALDYEGTLSMSAAFYSARKKARRQELLNLYPNNRRLRFNHDTGAGDVELIGITDTTISFLYRRVLTVGRGSSRREHFFALSFGGDTITIDQKLYIQGKLSSVEIWRLKKE